MTKTKTILGISLAAIFATSMIFAQSVVADDDSTHLDILKSEVKVVTKDGESSLTAKLKVGDDIPTDGTSGLFGYGIITDPDTFNNVLALTSHGGAFDHTSQSGASDPIFHAHILDLAAPGTLTVPDSCVGFDAVVDFKSSLDSGNEIDAQYEVKVKDNKIEVKNVPTTDLNDAGVEGIVSFTITGLGSDPTAPVTLPFLCLDIIG